LKRQLIELSRLYGIQTSYLDMTRRRRDADPETLLLTLKAMGAGVNQMDDVPEALRRRKDELQKRKAQPVMVAWDGKLGKQRFELGYHDIEVNGQPVLVISAPKKAHYRPERLWGIFAPAYALHSKRNPAAGDLTDFENLMDWMGGLGGSVAATLPLLGAFLNEPFEPSPYSPATRLFWNEFYIDLARVPEYQGSSGSIQPPRRTKFVDYRSVMSYKRRVLERMAQQFFSSPDTERRRAFRKFLRANDGVEDYAGFRAVMDRQQRSWHEWPARLRDGTIRKSDYDDSARNYHLYSQWIIQEQLESLSKRMAARGQFLYLDLPLGLNSAGYDVWRNRGLFVDGVSGGAPPDPVFTKGQNWGFPPMNPEAMRLNRYQYFIAFLRNHFQYAKLLRIDHVMGLHRLYWIPAELSGEKGVYVEYPADELWAILCLESHRYQAGVVGENLGTVPTEVNQSMARHAIREMYVVQYELMGDGGGGLRPPPEKCVASLNTHDMPPFRAFLDGADIDDRLDLGLIDEKTARCEHKDRAKIIREYFRDAPQILAVQNLGCVPKILPQILEFLAGSMANIVLVNLEDLWEETLPQNVPSTSTERPNWRRRLRPGLEQIRKMAGVAEVLSNVFAQRPRSLPL
jgi:4-alpha-glucanotransferase